MKITELEMDEIGLHPHLKAQLNSPLVGLMGPNASGKSTILGFLGFLFTGITAGDPPEPQETFVRYWGREGAAANGWGRIKFIQHGQEGEIFRQVGKTPKRWLKWGLGPNGDGKPYTKAKEIEQVLTDIFGSNRKAMTQAIFIPQGQLDKLFFGGEAEREEMFVRLLQIAYTEKAEKAIGDKQNFVGAGIQDLSLLTDEIATQRNTVEVSLAELERELNGTRDWAGDLGQLREFRGLVRQADQEMEAGEQHARDLTTAENNLREVLARSAVKHGGIPIESSGQAASAASVDRQRHSSLDVERQRHAAAQVLLTNWKSLEGQIAAAKTQLDQLEYDSEALREIAEKDTATLLTSIKAIDDWNTASTAAAEAVTKMQGASAALLNFEGQTKVVTQEEIDAAEEKFRVLCDASANLTLKRNAWTCVAGQNVAQCPICENDFDVNAISPERLAEIKQKLEVADSEARTAGMEVSRLRDARKKYDARRAELVGAWNAATADAKAKENNTQRPEGDRAELSRQYDTITDARSKRSALIQPTEQCRRSLTHLQTQAAAVPQRELAQAAALYNPTKAQEIEAEMTTLATHITELESLVGRCRPAEDTIVSSQRLLDTSKAKHASLLTQAAENEHKFSSTLSAFLKAPEIPENVEYADAVDFVEQTLQARVSERLKLIGRVSQARTQADEIRRKQEELQAKTDSDAKRIALRRDLQTLRNVFTRSGLPMRFVRYKFEQLAELTRQGLIELEANFSVQIDPAHSVSFTFTQLDEGEPYVMPQCKLSGGQKVRLSTAFLLAVQKLLVPEVAFLVLDEPSLHLDLEGKESLKEMFISMAERLGNSESQIWVCDHAPELEPAFGNIIRTKRKA